MHSHSTRLLKDRWCSGCPVLGILDNAGTLHRATAILGKAICLSVAEWRPMARLQRWWKDYLFQEVIFKNFFSIQEVTERCWTERYSKEKHLAKNKGSGFFLKTSSSKSSMFSLFTVWSYSISLLCIPKKSRDS